MVIINLINSINESITDIVNDIKKYLNNMQDKELEIEKKISYDDRNTKLVIDRFEGEFAVCEGINNSKVINIKREKLPVNAREGNVLKYEDNRYVIDFKATKSRKRKIKEITKDLWEN